VNTINIQKHMKILGFRVEDKVTGFKGVAASICFDLYGCVQVVVNPGIGNDGKLGEQIWFDIARLKVTNNKPVMNTPDFEYGPQAEGLKGPAEKPAMLKA
jgi:hypothetical protein